MTENSRNEKNLESPGLWYPFNGLLTAVSIIQRISDTAAVKSLSIDWKVEQLLTVESKTLDGYVDLPFLSVILILFCTRYTPGLESITNGLSREFVD